MMFAIRKDKQGYRVIDDAADLLPGETLYEGDTPPVLVPAATELQISAQKELDIVTGAAGQVMRCAAAGVPLTSVWITYIAEVRAIRNGSSSLSALPTRPDYISGT